MSPNETPSTLPEPAASLPEEGELSDAELEFVVGGLTRPWEEPPLPWNTAPRVP